MRSVLMAALLVGATMLMATCVAGPTEDPVEPETTIASTLKPSEQDPATYLPIESFRKDSATHLRFRRPGGYVEMSPYGTVTFVETSGTSEVSTLVRSDRISELRLDLHMADTSEFSLGDIIEVAVTGEFPGSPARFGAVVEDVEIFYGIPTGFTQREYLESFMVRGLGEYRHILYTVAVHS